MVLILIAIAASSGLRSLMGENVADSVAEAMLRPYPELWRQWQAQMHGPWEDGLPPGPGDVRMYHSPTYLRAVIREYEHLREGGDRPDPALAARCEAIVVTRPEIAKKRRRQLNDPWWRATGPLTNYMAETVAHHYDPDYLQNKVDYANRLDDPFDRAAIETRLWLAKWDAPSAKAAEAPNN